MTNSQKLSSIFRFIIISCAIFILANSKTMLLDVDYLDNISIIYMMLICLVVFIASLGRIVSLSPLNNAVTFILIFYLIGRLAVLSLYPDGLLGYNTINSTMFNNSLCFILVGTVACYLGLGIGVYKKTIHNLASIQHNPAETNNPLCKLFKKHLLLLTGITILFILFGFFIHSYFGYSGSTGSGSHSGFFRRYVARMIDPRMMFLVTIAYYYSQKRFLGERIKKYRRPLFVLVALFFILQTFLGSRAGVLEIIFIFLSVQIFVEGDFRIKVNIFRLLLFAICGAFLLYIYQSVTIFRDYSWKGGHYDLNSILLALKHGGNLVKSFQFEDIFKIVSHRMSILWPNIYIINVDKLGVPIYDIVNLKTTILSIIDRIVPGNIFEGLLFQEYAFSIIIGSSPYYINGTLNYPGYTWSMYGISYQLFGFYGGAGFIFFISFMFGKCICFLKRRRSFLSVVFGSLLIYTLLGWVRNFGIDNLADKLFHQGVLLFIYVVLFQYLRRIRVFVRPRAVPQSV